jgi:hypothetical protein
VRLRSRASRLPSPATQPHQARSPSRICHQVTTFRGVLPSMLRAAGGVSSLPQAASFCYRIYPLGLMMPIYLCLRIMKQSPSVTTCPTRHISSSIVQWPSLTPAQNKSASPRSALSFSIISETAALLTLVAQEHHISGHTPGSIREASLNQNK